MLELFPYGIQTENSDFRVHVCVKAKQVWYYPTSAGILAMFNYPLKDAYDSYGKHSGKGHLVPCRSIEGVKLLKSDPNWFSIFSKDQHHDDETGKGNKAVQVVRNIIYHGNFPFCVKDARSVDDIKLQIEGVDLLVLGDTKIQVKCDWKGGDWPGTGKLYLQVAERNYHAKH